MRSGTTIGFPHGGHTTAVKVFESDRAMDDGATELDMVDQHRPGPRRASGTPSGPTSFRDGRGPRRGAIVKVIFENCYLMMTRRFDSASICGEVGADYVKTSTGYGTGGSAEADLLLMRRSPPTNVKLKAAGGVRTLDAAIAVPDSAATGSERAGPPRCSTNSRHA